MLYLYLMIGGALGTVARYELGGWIHSWAGAGFPWGTFVINLVGSFLLGLAIQIADVSTLSPEVRGMLTVGFCGAFTTFSTFTFEAVSLMQAGAWTRALAYTFGSVGLGLAAMMLGLFTVGFLMRNGV